MSSDTQLHNDEAEVITAEQIEKIRKLLSQGKQVRHNLPQHGRLHIDRPLPFLCVYRQPIKTADVGTEQLVTGEASHLIICGEPRQKSGTTALVRVIAETLASQFQAFLIVEIWSAPPRQSNNGNVGPLQPAFKVVTSHVRPPTTTIEALTKSLRRIKIQRQPASVEVVDRKKRAPSQMSMLLSSTVARKSNCYLLGLEIDPVYQNPKSNTIFPMVLRTLHRGLARAFRRTFFEFSRTQTTYHPPNYQALGRRALVKAVWNVDKQLAEISNAFEFLLQVTPVNSELAWNQFKRAHFERSPVFYYRPVPVDPALLKRKLFQVPIERVEDPTLAFLFREKRHELDRQLTMLNDRGTRRFLYGSLQLFGGVSEDLERLAREVLTKIPPRSRERNGQSYFTAAAFADRAKGEIEYYRQFYPDISATIQIRDDVAGLMVSRGNLLISRQSQIPASRVEALIQHEVGTHLLTYFNGSAQPFQQLYTGLAGYEELQEGIAVLSEYFVGGLSRPRLRLLAGRVMAAQFLIQGASFIETFRELHHTFGFAQRTAFTIVMRIYRGGGLTKDAIYLRGLVAVLKYIKDGGQLDPLFVGKIASDHIPIIKELQWRQVLRPTPLYPRYMKSQDTAIKIEKLRNSTSLLDLIERKQKTS
ncbi:MAG: DUF1704 domain-containing protein [Anaerolineae bacterium]|nr:DUF1704 domain-containing protein [Anaerolineae bacterium]